VKPPVSPFILPTLLAFLFPPPARADGLTADEVADRAQASSYTVRARTASRAAADSAVDQANAAFLPRLSGIARYTRLSSLTPPVLGNIVVAPGTPAGGTPDPASLIALPFTFPLLQDQYAAQATLQVPLSDYLLRFPQARAAARGNARAAALGEAAVRLQVGVDARVAYYNWVRARKQIEVAASAVEQARGHLADARTGATAGSASPADVLRVESQVAGAELLLTRATNAADVAEQTLRTLMHDEAGRAYTVGEDVTADVAPAGEPAANAPLAPLFAEAAERRLELRALDEEAGAATQQAAIARTAGLPRLDAVGNAVYANPNPRIIPLQDRYRGTWDATIQLSWTPTDLATTEAARRAALARAAELEAERAALVDGIRLEVTQTSGAVDEARAAVATSRRGLTSAEESYRVRRVLYQNGRATSVELTDAETELTRGRLEVIAAEIDLRIARARLTHALGRDTARTAKTPVLAHPLRAGSRE
jgi:outer membrane protein